MLDWKIRQRGDGATAFDDGLGEVSGAWVQKRRPAEPGMMIYVMVDSIAATCDKVMANGGQIVERGKPDAREAIATFRDPAGNLMGLYQE